MSKLDQTINRLFSSSDHFGCSLNLTIRPPIPPLGAPCCGRARALRRLGTFLHEFAGLDIGVDEFLGLPGLQIWPTKTSGTCWSQPKQNENGVKRNQDGSILRLYITKKNRMGSEKDTGWVWNIHPQFLAMTIMGEKCCSTTGHFPQSNGSVSKWGWLQSLRLRSSFSMKRPERSKTKQSWNPRS